MLRFTFITMITRREFSKKMKSIIICITIKSDILSTNKFDIEKFFFCFGVLLSLDYCLGNLKKKTKKRFITFSQILKTRKFKCFREKFNFLKTQNTLLCLKEKFKKKNLQSVPSVSQTKYFFLVLPREFCAYVSFVLIFMHVKLI